METLILLLGCFGSTGQSSSSSSSSSSGRKHHRQSNYQPSNYGPPPQDNYGLTPQDNYDYKPSKSYRSYQPVNADGCDLDCIDQFCVRCMVDNNDQVSCKMGRMHKRCQNRCCGGYSEPYYEPEKKEPPYKQPQGSMCPEIEQCVKSCFGYK